MKILPLKSIWPEDVDDFGLEIVNLVKLYHAGLPIPDGLSVTPPTQEFEKIFKKGNYSDLRVFQDNFGSFTAEVLKISCPLELSQAIPTSNATLKQIWVDLLKQWLDEIKSLKYRGINDPMSQLTAKYCLFTSVIRASGLLYYSKALGDSRITIDQGNLSPLLQKQLDEYAEKTQNIFLLHYAFRWVLDDTLKFTKVEPMGDVGVTENELISPEKRQTEPPKRILVTKVFINIGANYAVPSYASGLVVEVDKIDAAINQTHLLVEAASSYPTTPILFKLEDLVDSFGGSRGSYSLLHHNERLEAQIESFLYARNKKSLINVQICLPMVRSVEEFNQMKRMMMAMGVSRKGSLKLWMEIATPENILNIADYLVSGLDGVVLNLDLLGAWVGGYDPESEDSLNYRTETSALNELLVGGFKALTRSKVPVLVKGRLINDDQMLAFLVKNGILGLIVNTTDQDVVENSLIKAEKLVFK